MSGYEACGACGHVAHENQWRRRGCKCPQCGGPPPYDMEPVATESEQNAALLRNETWRLRAWRQGVEAARKLAQDMVQRRLTDTEVDKVAEVMFSATGLPAALRVAFLSAIVEELPRARVYELAMAQRLHELGPAPLIVKLEGLPAPVTMVPPQLPSVRLEPK